MSNKCEHDENRKKVCAPCGRKIIFGKRKLDWFIVSEKFATLIRKYINSNYDICDSKFPSGICTTCRLTLLEHENEINKRLLPKMPNYHEMILVKDTRSKNDYCNCFICVTGRYVGHSKIKKGKGHHRCMNNIITSTTGLYGASNINKPIKKIVKPKNCKKVMKMCEKCFQEVGKGKNHVCCNKKGQRVYKNVRKIVNALPEKQQEKIVSSVLHSKIDKENRNSKHCNVNLKIATNGSPSTIVMNPIKKKRRLCFLLRV